MSEDGHYVTHEDGLSMTLGSLDHHPPAQFRVAIRHGSALTTHPFGVDDRPMFRCGEQAPDNRPGLTPINVTGVSCSHWSALRVVIATSQRGVSTSSVGAPCALAAVHARDRVFEWSVLERELRDVEIAAVAQHGEHDATEAMGDGNDRHFVAPACTQGGEVWIERRPVGRRCQRQIEMSGISPK